MSDRIDQAIAMNLTVARHIGAISTRLAPDESVSWDAVAEYIAHEEECTVDEAFDMMEQARRDGMFSGGCQQ
ncbi:hypothetical protein B0W47_00635 [Komagataeibacter nataicola]|uniref:Uncharacterized protein n=1 Tax=Komagataeibacter nataicola TaxID=265960 RepID=A0A9N7H1X6_9PROT|nr:hypothetical protein [Komagataeibacter nataicola]AQU86208.1 hypothetical protein B0W47_00635 [Komagataeibacter nataicola]PYD65342.1 hypothetical protein CDI09_14140 [Komagataeibacter nataicola]WNM08389.1 hypothetical protein RI056_16250 [Komagataeibacter nataicola]